MFNPKPGRGDRTKIKILEGVIRCIATKGIDGTNLETIGQFSGLHRAHVAYHFPERIEMIRMTVKYAIAVGQSITIEKLKKAKGWREQLEAWVDGVFTWVEQYPDHSVVMRYFYAACAHEPSFRELNTEIRKMGAQRFVSFMSSVFGQESDPKEIYRLGKGVQALLTGSIIDYVTTKPEISFLRQKRETLTTIFALIEPKLGKTSPPPP